MLGLGDPITANYGSVVEAVLSPRSRSWVAGARWLVIVVRDQPHLAGYLRQQLAGDAHVQILLDRRRVERRRRAEPAQPDRRRAQRRRPTGFQPELRLHWVAVCRALRSSPRAGDLGASDHRKGRTTRMTMMES